ncbi:MAG: hypothetical protein RAP03_03685 [Candidatus Electryonea clarkiae]|nr:hypothetical protein [Candidatus Electryonea clarkiae]
MDKCGTKEFANIDKKVREAQIQLLYQQTWTGLSGVLIVALTACVVFWQVVPQWKLSLWAGISVLLTLARGCMILAFQRRAPLTSDIDRWATLHVIGVIVSALMWTIPSIFLWPAEDSVFQLVWPILILPLSAAAVATYYTWKPSYASFLVLTVVPISLRFFYEGGFLFNIMGLLALFFIAVLLRAGRVMHAASVRTFEVGISNEALNMDLKEGITTREQLNVRLQQEIAERTLSEEKLSRRNQDLVRLNEELTSTKFNLESSNKKLEDAIADIMQLSGMLPICASCKKIRDDKGYWNQIESYIRDHSDAEFSHSICPDCAKKLYPDLDLYEDTK